MIIDVQYAVGLTLNEDVYNRDKSLMLIPAGATIKENTVDKLKKHGVTTVRVNVDELKDTLPDMLLAHVMESISSGNITEVAQIANTFEEIAKSVSHINIDMTKYVNFPISTINPLLLSTLSIGPAINVVKYYNNNAGKANQLDIKEVVTAIMLQDIGYICSNSSIHFASINAAYKSDYERLLLEYPNLQENGLDGYQKELHPIYSYYLAKDNHLTDTIEKAILLHNEPYQDSTNGSLKTTLKTEEVRYPKAAKIAMIIKAVGVYNQLLFAGVKANPEYPFEVIPKYLDMLVANGTLSPEFVNILKEVVPLYPEGSLVKLSDGTVAKVTRFSKSNMLKPDIADLNDEPIDYIDDLKVAYPIREVEEYKRPKHL